MDNQIIQTVPNEQINYSQFLEEIEHKNQNLYDVLLYIKLIVRILSYYTKLNKLPTDPYMFRLFHWLNGERHLTQGDLFNYLEYINKFNPKHTTVLREVSGDLCDLHKVFTDTEITYFIKLLLQYAIKQEYLVKMFPSKFDTNFGENTEIATILQQIYSKDGRPFSIHGVSVKLLLNVCFRILEQYSVVKFNITRVDVKRSLDLYFCRFTFEDLTIMEDRVIIETNILNNVYRLSIQFKNQTKN